MICVNKVYRICVYVCVCVCACVRAGNVCMDDWVCTVRVFIVTHTVYISG